MINKLLLSDMSCSIPESVIVKESFVTGTNMPTSLKRNDAIILLKSRPNVEVHFSYVHCDTDRTPTAQNKTSAWSDFGTPIVTRPGKQLHHLALRSGCQKPRNTGQQIFQNCACVKLETFRNSFISSAKQEADTTHFFHGWKMMDCVDLDIVSFSDEVWFTLNEYITSQNNRLGVVKLPVYCLIFTSSSGVLCYAQNRRTSVSEREKKGKQYILFCCPIP
jgi:hypothetical protein